MRYVQRDEHGEIIGHYSHQHPYAMEEMADDDPRITEWRTQRRARADAEKRRVQDAAAAEKKALEDRVAALEAIVKKLR